MAAVLTMYGLAPHAAFNGDINWDGASNIKVGLLTAYTPDYDAHDTWTAVKAAGTEHGAANGYSTGGVVMGSVTHGYTAGGVTLFGSASIIWTATGALTAKYAVAYDVASDNAIFCINLDGAGGDVTATDAAFTITDASGWFSIDAQP